MPRPHYVEQLITLWGEPRVTAASAVKKGWTWFPGDVNHSITLWLGQEGQAEGLHLTCHDQLCLQIQVRHPSRELMPVEIAAFITMAGWQNARLKRG